MVNPGDFADLEELADRLLGFQDRYNATAERYDWYVGRQSLDRLIERLTTGEPATV